MAKVATAPSSRRWMTADELLAMPDDGNRYELVRGELSVMSPPSVPPTIVGGNVHGWLWTFLREHLGRGICGISEAGFLLEREPDTVRAPDVWFLRAEHIPQGGVPDGFWPGPPDLAVEVLSLSDRFIDVLRKAQDYLTAGTRLVWIIDPTGRSAAVFTPAGVPTLLSEDGVLDGADVLPGFTLALRDVLA